MNVYLKRFLVLGIIALILISFAVIVLTNQATDVREKNRVVTIYLQGPIQEGQGAFTSTAITPRRVASLLKRSERDPTIKAVVLRINSPGGSVASSQEIATMIREFNKPIVVSMADMVASGGYYISAPADGIVAHPGTMTGSIGVIFSLMNTEGLYEKLGIELEVIKSGEHKDMFARSLSEEEKQLIQDLSDEAYQQFIEEIMQGRNLNKEYVKELATGELFIGTQAKELGLVDKLGGIQEAVDLAASLAGIENPIRYEFPAPTLFEQLRTYSYQVLTMIPNLLVPSELLILERIKEGLDNVLQYKVLGY